ncbi:glycoside hydrolase family 25 protein [Rhizobium leguminosarum]|uniref:glycoside hydrolase family 25 protein n=1 Tax=Rhizobium leguminosarum TaxID=384 RepID=UPI003D7C27B5
MQGANVILDISHHNGRVKFDKLAQVGIVGIIHKTTQGQTGVDPNFESNRAKALAEGLLWGAYHFATGSDGLKQAQHFLSTVEDLDNTVLVLDFEPNPTGPSMGLEEARAFVTHVKDVTGRYPGFYSGHYIKQLLGTSNDPILAQCWFWLAQYGPTAVVPPIGRHGRCGNIPTGHLVPNHMTWVEHGSIATPSTAVSRISELSGERNLASNASELMRCTLRQNIRTRCKRGFASRVWHRAFCVNRTRYGSVVCRAAHYPATLVRDSALPFPSLTFLKATCFSVAPEFRNTG